MPVLTLNQLSQVELLFLGYCCMRYWLRTAKWHPWSSNDMLSGAPSQATPPPLAGIHAEAMLPMLRLGHRAMAMAPEWSAIKYTESASTVAARGPVFSPTLVTLATVRLSNPLTTVFEAVCPSTYIHVRKDIKTALACRRGHFAFLRRRSVERKQRGYLYPVECVVSCRDRTRAVRGAHDFPSTAGIFASIVLPRPTSSARSARPRRTRTTRRTVSSW
jgi:hypothetical protein